MSMYQLIEYSNNYSKRSTRLGQCCRNEQSADIIGSN